MVEQSQDTDTRAGLIRFAADQFRGTVAGSDRVSAEPTKPGPTHLQNMMSV